MEALLYFAFWAALIFLMMRFGCGAHVMGHGHGQHGEQRADRGGSPEQLRWVPPVTDVDPVCGKTVQTDRAKSSVNDGSVYYFCSRECREQFEAAPHLYVGAQGSQQPTQMDDAHG